MSFKIIVALLSALSAASGIASAQQDFVNEFFIKPLVEGTGYNIVNTTVFALILIAAAFGVYRLLKKLNITIDKNFMIGVIPYVAMGGILRAWEDLSEIGGTRNFLLVTPLIYVVIFIAAFLLLLISIAAAKISKKTQFFKVWFAIGAVIDIYFLIQLKFADSFAFLAVLGLAIFWTALFLITKFIAKKRFKKLDAFLTKENMFIILVHMFDASTTFVALQYLGYWEQHVLPGFLIGIVGAWSMFLLKLLVVPVVLFAFDKELSSDKDKEKKNFLKLVVLILGLAPGLRNWLRMIGGF